ncbi:MAG: GtrA family protein [Acidimicrobiia bacterium]|nr:GtrA family protein [Acidimicrobiia bacterium]MDH5420342.1 GtrA family protein [Acidimicrobiia bacterium]MDH5502899.1 GtrA family protein [Acidimicrobiia bacterium]
MKNYIKSFLNRTSANQFIKLSLIGGLNTVLDFVLANLFKVSFGFSSQASVVTAFTIATGASYLMNRRFTFSISGGRKTVRETGAFFLVNGIALAVTSGFVALAELWFGDNLVVFNGAKVAATVIVLFPKFAGYRDLVFRRSLSKEIRS